MRIYIPGHLSLKQKLYVRPFEIMKLLVTFAAYATADICAQPEEDPDYQVCEGKVTEKYTGNNPFEKIFNK